MQRDVLPMPDRPHEGLITYDAKDPDTSFPPIEPLRPPAGAPNVLIVLGLIQLTGGFSLMAGNAYGRVIGVIGASLVAIGALLSIGGSYPWWSLGIFVLCIYVVHGILVYGEDERVAR